MAALDFSRSTASGLSVGGRIVATLSNVQAAFVNWYADRATRRELSKLSDHELNDIGLIRGDIDNISARILH